MSKRRGKAYDGERFMAISFPMFEHSSFKTLSDKARSILLLMLYRYNGSNNGEIHLTSREIQKWYGYGKGTAHQKLIELYEHGFIFPVKIGCFTTRLGTIWRLTFKKTDKDIPTNDWKRFDKNKNKVPDFEPYETIDRTF
ncbi:MAG: hypothetical protein PUH03_02265 [bacterium]|nr:hypothetical protein [bacterium]MDY2830984.1 hypothetical protein [Alphaproteobacteria bacterium]